MTVTPNGEHFVKPEVQLGVLPEILQVGRAAWSARQACVVRKNSAQGTILPAQELLAARKRAKADMATAEDPFLKAVYNGRQMALKVRTLLHSGCSLPCS